MVAFKWKANMKNREVLKTLANRGDFAQNLLEKSKLNSYLAGMGRQDSSKGNYNHKPPKKSQAPVDLYRKSLGIIIWRS